MTTGILIIDKPEDWTSHDVVAKLRGVFKEKRIGHAGTLDPMATGVLPIFLGRATRVVEFATEGQKEYVAGLRLGEVTDTQDITGSVLKKQEVNSSEETLLSAFPDFLGDIQQIPPMYSAIKIKGKKLYELARKGQEIERPPRNITISKLELLPEKNKYNDPLLLVECSKGTYIRTLCHDLGEKLGCGGTMSSLRRTKAAGFSLEDSFSLEEVVNHSDPKSLLLPVDSYFQQPTFVVEPWQEQKLRNGTAFLLDKNQKVESGDYRVYSDKKEFLAICQVNENKVTTIKSFFEV